MTENGTDFKFIRLRCKEIAQGIKNCQMSVKFSLHGIILISSCFKAKTFIRNLALPVISIKCPNFFRNLIRNKE